VNKQDSARRYLAAHLPFLPAQRLIRSGGAPPDSPFAVIEKRRGALRIVALPPAACALGLIPGMALADARARIPGLPAFDHDPSGDAALLMWLVGACERYTPTVAASGTQSLVMDLTGCLEVAGMDEGQLHRDLQARLARQGLQSALAWASTPDAALALARFGCARAEDLPVAALELDGGVHLALQRAGLRRIGDLKTRPRAALAARFGTQLPVQLACLLGEEDRHITPHRTPPAIYAECRFAEPMATLAPLLDVIRALAGDTERQLAQRAWGGRRFEVTLFRTDGHVTHLSVASGQVLRDPARIATLFNERLETLADPLDPGFGYDMMRLAVPVTQELAEEQADLASDSRTQGNITALLDRLTTRFGAESLCRFHPRDEHFPEYAASFSPMPPQAHEWPARAEGDPPLRPLFLYDPPQRTSVLAEVPDGPPLRFSWRGQQHLVLRHEGPERIAYPWWKHPDGHGPTRDYYRVEDDQGRRFWLFRHGLYGQESTHPQWYVHGLFA